MNIQEFLEKLKNTPTEIPFKHTMDLIDTHYDFKEVSFINGEITNEAGQNSGSCKLFSFAQLQNLSKKETLYCFGEHYKNVLDTPNGSNHQNIRNFMNTGWDGISFGDQALREKTL